MSLGGSPVVLAGRASVVGLTSDRVVWPSCSRTLPGLGVIAWSERHECREIASDERLFTGWAGFTDARAVRCLRTESTAHAGAPPFLFSTRFSRAFAVLCSARCAATRSHP